MVVEDYSEQPISVAEQINLHYFLGTVISATLLKDYAGGLQTVAKEKKANYLANKALHVEKSAEQLVKAMQRRLDIIGAKDMIANEVQRSFDLIFDVLSLPMEGQIQVTNLISILKKNDNA